MDRREQRAQARRRLLAEVNEKRLLVGQIYSFSNKCSYTCICCPTYIGVFLGFEKKRYAEFKLVYPANGIIRIRTDMNRFLFKEADPPISPTLAKQYARGLCEYIPEDCAGIIETFLTCMAGEGPFRYPLRN